MNALLERSRTVDREILEVRVEDVGLLDCHKLVTRFPALTSLTLVGSPGSLVNAREISELKDLRLLLLHDTFGMEPADAATIVDLRQLERLVLHSVPKGYADAMKGLWNKEQANGTAVIIKAARKPEWLAENLNNPLRAWDGREHISPATYKKSVNQYKLTLPRGQGDR